MSAERYWYEQDALEHVARLEADVETLRNALLTLTSWLAHGVPDCLGEADFQAMRRLLEPAAGSTPAPDSSSSGAHTSEAGVEEILVAVLSGDLTIAEARQALEAHAPKSGSESGGGAAGGPGGGEDA